MKCSKEVRNDNWLLVGIVNVVFAGGEFRQRQTATKTCDRVKIKRKTGLVEFLEGDAHKLFNGKERSITNYHVIQIQRRIVIHIEWNFS